MRRSIRILAAHVVRQMDSERGQRADPTENEYRECPEKTVRGDFGRRARHQRIGVRRAGVDEFRDGPGGRDHSRAVLQRTVFRPIRASDLYQKSTGRSRLFVDTNIQLDIIVRHWSRHRKRGSKT